MSTPVTRGELREELTELEHRFDGKLEQLEHRFDGKLEQLEHRFDGKLELWGGALLARIEQSEKQFEKRLELWGGALLSRIEQTDKRVELLGSALLARIEESESRLLGEIARHTQAVYESMTTQISVVDEKYNDLPARTARLELDVHALKQR